MKLEQLQKKIIYYITDPHTQEADFSVVKAQKGISPKERLGSYRNSCLNRLVESFKGDFEVTLHFIGEEVFEKYAFEYLHAHPSQTHYINELGKGFSVFLKESIELAEYPFLFELIDLEWKMVESFYDFSRLDSDPLENSNLWVNPSLIFESSSWPLDKIWENQKAYPAEDILFASFCRMDRVSRVLRLNNVEHAVLKSLFETRSLEMTIEKLDSQFSEQDLLPIFQKSLSSWVEKGLIRLK